MPARSDGTQRSPPLGRQLYHRRAAAVRLAHDASCRTHGRGARQNRGCQNDRRRPENPFPTRALLQEPLVREREDARNLQRRAMNLRDRLTTPLDRTRTRIGRQRHHQPHVAESYDRFAAHPLPQPRDPHPTHQYCEEPQPRP